MPGTANDVTSSAGVVDELLVTGSRTFERPDRGHALVLLEPDRREARVERERLEGEAVDQLRIGDALNQPLPTSLGHPEDAANGPECRRCAPCLASC